MSYLFTTLNHDPLFADSRANREVRELTEASKEDVLSLLTREPLRTITMMGLIQDHGMVSPGLRGRFFGYYENNALAGVGLLGHAMLTYALPEAEAVALKYLAEKAIEIQAKGHVIFGPRASVELFYQFLAQGGRKTRLTSEHLWCVCEKPGLPLDKLQLSRANLDDLEAVANAQAEMIREASGIDPRETDLAGFLNRTAERIERKRTWVMQRSSKVIFKVEIVSQTPDAAYLEGVWVDPEHREQGLAKSCLNELTHRLLKQTKAICLIVDVNDEAAQKLYQRIGFVHRETFLAHYLKPLEA